MDPVQDANAVVQIGQTLYNLFGAKVHNTPGGAPYEESSALLTLQEKEIDAIKGIKFSPPADFGSDYQTFLKGILARVLGNPAIANSDYSDDQQKGIVDLALSAQQAELQSLSSPISSAGISPVLLLLIAGTILFLVVMR